MIVSVHQPQYIPWLGYFDKIARSDCFVFLDCVQYKEREFQNRNRIRLKDGWMWLSVPVIAGGARQPIGAVKIDNGADWRRTHRESLRTWYGGAPFFGEQFPFFDETYAREWESLSELNVHITRYLLKALAISTPLVFESELKISGTSTRRIVEICKALKADTYLSGGGGREYLDEPLFAENGITLRYQEFTHPVYEQRFMPFEPYMSCVDLLFNHGAAGSSALLLHKA